MVLKCVWKLARNIPQDLTEHHLDPVELFPAIEHFLQSIPPNEWRARATNKIPCGDMPLRTIKVIIQHVVGQCKLISLTSLGTKVWDQATMAMMFTIYFLPHSMIRPRLSSIHTYTGF